MGVEELVRLCGQLGSERQSSASLGRCRKMVTEDGLQERESAGR
jgi:hypothetical protein